MVEANKEAEVGENKQNGLEKSKADYFKGNKKKSMNWKSGRSIQRTENSCIKKRYWMVKLIKQWKKQFELEYRYRNCRKKRTDRER